MSSLNFRNPKIHKAVGVVRVGDAERYRRLIRDRPASNVQNHPDIRKLKVPRRVAVTQAQNASAEDLFVVASRVGSSLPVFSTSSIPSSMFWSTVLCVGLCCGTVHLSKNLRIAGLA